MYICPACFGFAVESEDGLCYCTDCHQVLWDKRHVKNELPVITPVSVIELTQ